MTTNPANQGRCHFERQNAKQSAKQSAKQCLADAPILVPIDFPKGLAELLALLLEPCLHNNKTPGGWCRQQACDLGVAAEAGATLRVEEELKKDQNKKAEARATDVM